ncbi:MAG: hypothetical protein KGJ81_11660, partial [Alphaproteobacteria bacterium]|nr:hypothetical protein [Alphaproteobacteria bacterium]
PNAAVVSGSAGDDGAFWRLSTPATPGLAAKRLRRLANLSAQGFSSEFIHAPQRGRRMRAMNLKE